MVDVPAGGCCVVVAFSGILPGAAVWMLFLRGCWLDVPFRMPYLLQRDQKVFVRPIDLAGACIQRTKKQKTEDGIISCWLLVLFSVFQSQYSEQAALMVPYMDAHLMSG